MSFIEVTMQPDEADPATRHKVLVNAECITHTEPSGPEDLSEDSPKCDIFLTDGNVLIAEESYSEVRALILAKALK